MDATKLIMPFGKHKGWALEKVPGIYLARLYRSQPDMMDIHQTVKQFIETNLSALLFTGKPIGPICDTLKVAFVDKVAADKELKRIRRDPRKHKKPIRSYECERCGLWHHTSREL